MHVYKFAAAVELRGHVCAGDVIHRYVKPSNGLGQAVGRLRRIDDALDSKLIQ